MLSALYQFRLTGLSVRRRARARHRSLSLARLYILLLSASLITLAASGCRAETWSEAESSAVRAISLTSLVLAPPPDPSNSVADREEAKRLGERLFFDMSLSSNGRLSCASCHQPELNFTDGRTRSQGVGELSRNAPSLVGVGFQSWFYADGRRDSLWSQALAPLEAPKEMGSTRVRVLQAVFSNAQYRQDFITLFGPLPFSLDELPASAGPYGDRLEQKAWRMLPKHLKLEVNRAFANLGRVIAAYERGLRPQPGKLEEFASALATDGFDEAKKRLTPDQLAGLRLFLDADKTQCINCHNGPLLTNNGFHNIGTAQLDGQQMDLGRVVGLQAVFADEFNCFGPYSGVPAANCEALRFVNTRDTHSPLLGAYKVPGLRGIRHTAPYGHAGQFATLRDLLKHYNQPPDKSQFNHELSPLNLTDQELNQMVEFLKIL